MKVQLITAAMLCVALSACSSDSDEGGVSPFMLDSPFTQSSGTIANTDDGETGQPVTTEPPVAPVTTGTSGSQSEDQLLNIGTSQDPGTAWSCTVPEEFDDSGDEVIFGFYGEGDGIIGIFEQSGTTQFQPVPFTFDSLGNATFTLESDDGTISTVVLGAPNFTDGTTFTSTVSGFGDNFLSNCEILTFVGETTTEVPEPPVTIDDSLEAQLLNAGSPAAPVDEWSCISGIVMFRFYSEGQGVISVGDESFDLQYTATGADEIEIFDGQDTGSLSSIQFTGADNFSGVFFDGEDAFDIDCTRQQAPALAQADSTRTNLSLFKSIPFEKGQAAI
ncbi:hypothetical protein OAM69_00345 [bacterium]|nr:hypothetical protein [bacterium]